MQEKFNSLITIARLNEWSSKTEGYGYGDDIGHMYRLNKELFAVDVWIIFHKEKCTGFEARMLSGHNYIDQINTGPKELDYFIKRVVGWL